MLRNISSSSFHLDCSTEKSTGFTALRTSCAPQIRHITTKIPINRLRKFSISLSARLLSHSCMRSFSSFIRLSALACTSFSFSAAFFSLSDTALSRLSTDMPLSFNAFSAFSFCFLCNSALFFSSAAFFFSSSACFSCLSLSLRITLCSVSCCTCRVSF